MSATTWLIIAIVGFSLSGVALAAAVFMFIKMNIPAVIGDLTGKTVAREIKAMRDANASSGEKLHKSSPVNANRGKLTESVPAEPAAAAYMAKAHGSKRLDRTGSGTSDKLEVPQKPVKKQGSTTEALSANVSEVDIEQKRAAAMAKARVTDVLRDEHQTDVLVQERQTELLAETRQTELLAETRQTELLTQTNQTDVLAEPAAAYGTSVLSEETVQPMPAPKPVSFVITKCSIVTHSDEVIQ